MNWYDGKMIKKDILVNNEKKIELEINCRTPNEDIKCRRIYRNINSVILIEKQINYPINILQSKLIVKGDEVGLIFFNLQSIKELINKYFELDKKYKYIITLEILYQVENVIPYLKINLYEIKEFKNSLSEETFNMFFVDDERIDSKQYNITNDSFFLISSMKDLMDLVSIEYFDDLFSDEKIEYLKKYNCDIKSFQDILKCPIIDVEFNKETDDFQVFNGIIQI
jgi:hypothetical protein